MKISFVATAFMGAIVASPAIAQTDGHARSGARVEAHFGYDKASVTDPNPPADSPRYRFSKEGLLYGIGIGYDFDLGAVLVGFEANLDFTSVSKNSTSLIGGGNPFCAPQPICNLIPAEAHFKLKRDTETAARLGRRVGGAGLIYGKLGYSNARAVIRVTTGGSTLANDTGDLDGIRLSAGYEHSFAGSAFGKIEYRHTNYDSDLKRNQLVAGVGVRF